MPIRLSEYKQLFRLAAQSVLSGLGIILFLHYAMPFAEHPRILNTMGLMLDIIGVTWIAYDIFPFHGQEEYGEEHAGRAGIETPEYKKFKRYHVAIGLHMVVIGFFFQILAYWVEELRMLLP
jgi:hypothetical protein